MRSEQEARLRCWHKTKKEVQAWKLTHVLTKERSMSSKISGISVYLSKEKESQA